MAKSTPRDEGAETHAVRLLKFPATNQVRVDVGNLREVLRRYGADRAGFFGRIPRLR